MFVGSAYEYVEQQIQRWIEVRKVNPRAELRLTNTSRIMDTLVELPPLPADLDRLWLDGLPMLKSLPSLPPALKKLHIINCPAVPAEDFAALPAGLECLDLRKVQLTDLSVLPKELTVLHVDLPGVTTVPAGFDSLERLSIRGAKEMVSLEVPPSISYLNLEGLPRLSRLPTLPQRLIFLSLERMESLHTLPELPEMLGSLTVRFTPLVTLPELPENIQLYLQLTELPAEVLSREAILPNQQQMREWVSRINRIVALRRNQDRCGLIKSELICSALCPERVARWLGEGTEADWALVDMMFGV
jgi:hypothetical protein